MRETEQRIEDKGRAGLSKFVYLGLFNNIYVMYTFNYAIVEQLSMDLEDARNEVRVQQRRNANNVKDLTKQLHQYRRYHKYCSFCYLNRLHCIYTCCGVI